MTESVVKAVSEAVAYIQGLNPRTPETGIILGTGLGKLVDHVEIEMSIDYGDIPNFPISTVEGHQGKLIFGMLAGKPVVIMQGRFHYYEGYSLRQATLPVRVMHKLGIKQLLVSNAAGGVNTTMKVGDIMLLTDHINLLPDNPLRGLHEPELGARFPDMSEAYDKKLIKKALNISEREGIVLHTGIYAAVAGPNFETQAEYRYVKAIGADAVGMSTVPEVIVCAQIGLPVLGVSAITDEAFPEEYVIVTHEYVIQAAAIAEPKMVAIFKILIAEC